MSQSLSLEKSFQHEKFKQDIQKLSREECLLLLADLHKAYLIYQQTTVSLFGEKLGVDDHGFC